MNEMDIIKSGYKRMHREIVPYMLKTEDAILRSRVAKEVNPIIWHAWHIVRTEDMYLNTVIFDQPQVFHEGSWRELLNINTNHIGTGMTMDEADELSKKVDLTQLLAYNLAVAEKLNQMIDLISTLTSDKLVPELEMNERLKRADAFPDGMRQNRAKAYAERSASESILGLLSHSYMHFGQFSAITKPL